MTTIVMRVTTAEIAHVMFVGTDDDYHSIDELLERIDAIEAYRLGSQPDSSRRASDRVIDESR